MKLFDPIPIRALPPNAITAGAMALGFASTALAAGGDFPTAAWLICLAALLDKLDGTVARRLGASSAFGVQFDSFADFVAYGIAPASLFWYGIPVLAPQAWGSSAGVLARPTLAAFVLVYAVITAVRLARFNVITTAHPRFFLGLPSTLSGALIAVLFLALPELGLDSAAIWALLPWLLPVNAALMLCNLPLPKLKRARSRPFFAFQIANAIAIFICIPLRVGFTYLLVVLVGYVVVGTVIGLRAQGAEPEQAVVPG